MKMKPWIVAACAPILIAACGPQAPFSQQSTTAAPAQAAVTPSQTIEIQSHLQGLGYPVGADASSFDGRTRNSIMAFERSIGMTPSGQYSQTVLAALRASSNARRNMAVVAPALAATPSIVPAPVVQPVQVAAPEAAPVFYELASDPVLPTTSYTVETLPASTPLAPTYTAATTPQVYTAISSQPVYDDPPTVQSSAAAPSAGLAIPTATVAPTSTAQAAPANEPAPRQPLQRRETFGNGGGGGSGGGGGGSGGGGGGSGGGGGGSGGGGGGGGGW